VTPVSRAAFLDRDGVINVDYGYVYRADQFELISGVTTALRRLQEAGMRLIVVTNQSGIARGLYGEPDYERLTEHMRGLLMREGIRLDGVYHCPHLPDAVLSAYRRCCDCRKLAEFGVDPAHSLLFGDKPSDIQAGRAAGIDWCCFIGRANAQSAGADCVAPDLLRGVEVALSRG
jgi:D-glycero-D-manno-heptose 1,7-bisphosphate phosphatase